MKPSLRPLTIAALIGAVFFALALVQSSSASFRKFYNFNGPARYLGNVCTDGFTISFAQPWEDWPGLQRKVEVRTSADNTEIISRELELNWTHLTRTVDEETGNASFTSSPYSPFCEAATISDPAYFAPNQQLVCGDLLRVYWPEPLSAGTKVDFLYYALYGDTWDNMMASCWEDDPKSCVTDFAVVDNCRVGSNRVQAQISSLVSASTTITSSLTAEIEAEDLDFPLPRTPGVDISLNGAGINSVMMSIVDPFGTVVYSHTAAVPPYCLFGKTEQGYCQPWVFTDHDYTWPAGQPVTPGPHYIRAVVDGYYSNDQTVDWAVYVQRTDWQEHRYLPFIEASSSWPATARQRSR
jgi:hypothetical protein